jgi:hypothetical protein
MTQTHTPGPWGYTDDIEDGYMDVRGSFADTVARVEAWDEESGAPSPEAIANAQLIAAAPELLENGEALGEAIERGDPQDIADRWLNLKTAIAKARGQA